jgi:hypothetical protein
VAGVVDDDVQAAVLGDDRGDRGLDRGVAEPTSSSTVRRSTPCSLGVVGGAATCGALRPAVSRIEA